MHFARIRVGIAGETAAEEGIFRGHIPDNLQFFATAINIVREYVRARNVFVNALVDLFRYVQNVDGARYDEGVIKGACTSFPSGKRGGSFVNAVYRNFRCLCNGNAVNAVMVRFALTPFSNCMTTV